MAVGYVRLLVTKGNDVYSMTHRSWDGFTLPLFSSVVPFAELRLKWRALFWEEEEPAPLGCAYDHVLGVYAVACSSMGQVGGFGY